ncbi:MAG: N-acetylmuramic acid 6-phosphate etherase, partial [Clostridia bacterium]|nr:N-acetylmuramic acid 6-phosphate etherase [Clostridia bacterium]
MNTESVNQKTKGISDTTTEQALYMINDEDATVSLAVRKVIPAIAKMVDAGVKTLTNGGRIFYCGCGTSGRLAVADAAECPPTYGVSRDTVTAVIAGGVNAMINAAEGCEDSRERGEEAFFNANVSGKDMVIGISAAGRPPFVLAFMEKAKELGCTVCAVVNNENTEMAKIADIAVETLTGAEAIKGSTRMKAGTSQKLILNMFSTTLFVKMGHTYQNYMVNMIPNNVKLRKRAVSMLTDLLDTDEEKATALLEEHGWDIKATIK